MAHVTYKVVPHDGGWTYTMNGVFAETYRTREAAAEAARKVAGEQRTPGHTEAILYEDPDGRWHEELSDGEDRPDAEVEG
ncbi:MAG: hypothetical protein JWM91_5382 [Rhodospirillales bacterium]|nr:hypothetical protein [Rhodospirillales bacterium]